MFTLKYYNNYNGFHYRCYNNHIFFTSTQKYRQSNNFQQENIDYILIEIIISVQNVKLFLLINCYTVPDICNCKISIKSASYFLQLSNFN